MVKNPKPRLCILAHRPFPVSEPRVAAKARLAVELGFEVDVIAMRRKGDRPIEIVDGARVIRLPICHRRGAGLFYVFYEYVAFTVLAATCALLLHLRRRYRIVHVFNPPDFLVLGAVLPKILGAQVIMEIQDLAPDLFMMRFGRYPGGSVARAILGWIERRATHLATAVITVHEPYRRELEHRGTQVEKIAVVLNSLDEAVLPSEDYNYGSSGFRVVYHGTITWMYGIDTIIDAIAILIKDIPGIKLEIYGDGDALPEAQKRARDRRVGESVEFSGEYLPQEEVLSRIRGANVGVSAILAIERNKPALPAKLLEYVAMSVPVVSSDLPGVREHFTEEEVMFFEAGDSESLAGAILRLAKSPPAAAVQAQAALRRYREYRWQVQAKKYAMLLADLDGGRELSSKSVAIEAARPRGAKGSVKHADLQ